MEEVSLFSFTSLDHVETGVDRLPDNLTKDDFIKLLTIFLEKSQEVEDSLVELANMRSIDLAYGVWLDYIGDILGVDRLGDSDDIYRERLKFRIAVSNSGGTPNIIIDLVKKFTKSFNVKISEKGVAFANISLDGQDNIGSQLFELIQEIKPIGTKWIIHSDFYKKSFVGAYESSSRILENFQTTNDGIVFENFLVTVNGVDFEPFFTFDSGLSYHPKSIVAGRNSFYYESPIQFETTTDGVNFEPFQVTEDGVNFEDFLVLDPSDPEYIPDNELTWWWEVNGDSQQIT